ncbi:MAG: DUF4350 domain-containing protein, partial [Candidatus Saliniplasma sp.]
MKRKIKLAVFYMILGSIVGLLLLFSLSAPLVTNDSDFSIYNRGWNGCSELAVRSYELGTFTPNLEIAEGREMQVVQKEITEYALNPEDSSIVFIGPEETFTEDEIDYVHDFLERGGTVLLADDFGSGNTLLNGLNTSSRFGTKSVLDHSFDKRPDFPVVYEKEEHEITEGIFTLLLNNPTHLDPDDGADVFLKTSEAAWIDVNETGVYDTGEPQDEFPIMSIESYGDGELILLSDPSILINSMLDQHDNRVFSKKLMDYLAEGKTDIIFDESHRDMSLVYRIVYVGQYPSRTVSLL